MNSRPCVRVRPGCGSRRSGRPSPAPARGLTGLPRHRLSTAGPNRTAGIPRRHGSRSPWRLRPRASGGCCKGARERWRPAGSRPGAPQAGATTANCPPGEAAAGLACSRATDPASAPADMAVSLLLILPQRHFRHLIARPGAAIPGRPRPVLRKPGPGRLAEARWTVEAGRSRWSCRVLTVQDVSLFQYRNPDTCFVRLSEWKAKDPPSGGR